VAFHQIAHEHGSDHDIRADHLSASALDGGPEMRNGIECQLMHGRGGGGMDRNEWGCSEVCNGVLEEAGPIVHFITLGACKEKAFA
jgi:hypothetical protein